MQARDGESAGAAGSATGVLTPASGAPPRDPAALATPRAPLTFREAFSAPTNGFGALRLGFATLVVLDHSFALGGFASNGMTTWTQGQATWGRLAVLGFFAISGYLITNSGLRGGVVQFLWRRALRILPGFWAAVVVGAFVVGPLAWYFGGGDLGDYFSRGEGSPYSYVRTNLDLVGESTVRDLFRTSTPWGRRVDVGVLNGTLWTLIYEARCYLLVAALMALGLLRKMPWVMPVLALAVLGLELAYAANPAAPAAVAPWLGDPYTFRFAYPFVIGGCIALYADRVPVDRRLALGCAALLAWTLHYGGLTTIGVPAGVYLTLYLAARLPRRLQAVGARNDYSYGVYLYGWMVQQGLAYGGLHQSGYVPYTAVTLVLTAACAWLSWHVVERQALRLKRWGPGRGYVRPPGRWLVTKPPLEASPAP